MKRYIVRIEYPNSHFKVGDILEESNRIPPGCFGKFINETTGWAWVHFPEKFPEIFKLDTQEGNGKRVLAALKEFSESLTEEDKEQMFREGCMEPNSYDLDGEALASAVSEQK